MAGLVLGSVLGACSDGDEEAESAAPPIGSVDGPCEVTVLTNGIDDQMVLTKGSDCFFGEVNAGRPVVWDTVIPTVEGDPILYRYEVDESGVTITEDARRDAFGSRSVLVRVCETVVRSEFLPEGIGCVESSGPGMELPESVWPFGS